MLLFWSHIILMHQEGLWHVLFLRSIGLFFSLLFGMWCLLSAKLDGVSDFLQPHKHQTWNGKLIHNDHYYTSSTFVDNYSILFISFFGIFLDSPMAGKIVSWLFQQASINNLTWKVIFSIWETVHILIFLWDIRD